MAKAKLNDEQEKEMRRRYFKERQPAKVIAAAFGVSMATMSRVMGGLGLERHLRDKRTDAIYAGWRS